MVQSAYGHCIERNSYAGLKQRVVADKFKAIIAHLHGFQVDARNQGQVTLFIRKQYRSHDQINAVITYEMMVKDSTKALESWTTVKVPWREYLSEEVLGLC